MNMYIALMLSKASNGKGEREKGKYLYVFRKQESNNKKFKFFASCQRTYYCNKFVKERNGHSIFRVIPEI